MSISQMQDEDTTSNSSFIEFVEVEDVTETSIDVTYDPYVMIANLLASPLGTSETTSEHTVPKQVHQHSSSKMMVFVELLQNIESNRDSYPIFTTIPNFLMDKEIHYEKDAKIESFLRSSFASKWDIIDTGNIDKCNRVQIPEPCELLIVNRDDNQVIKSRISTGDNVCVTGATFADNTHNALIFDLDRYDQQFLQNLKSGDRCSAYVVDPEKCFINYTRKEDEHLHFYVDVIDSTDGTISVSAKSDDVNSFEFLVDRNKWYTQPLWLFENHDAIITKKQLNTGKVIVKSSSLNPIDVAQYLLSINSVSEAVSIRPELFTTEIITIQKLKDIWKSFLPNTVFKSRHDVFSIYPEHVSKLFGWDREFDTDTSFGDTTPKHVSISTYIYWADNLLEVSHNTFDDNNHVPLQSFDVPRLIPDTTPLNEYLDSYTGSVSYIEFVKNRNVWADRTWAINCCSSGMLTSDGLETFTSNHVEGVSDYVNTVMHYTNGNTLPPSKNSGNTAAYIYTHQHLDVDPARRMTELNDIAGDFEEYMNMFFKNAVFMKEDEDTTTDGDQDSFAMDITMDLSMLLDDRHSQALYSSEIDLFLRGSSEMLFGFASILEKLTIKLLQKGACSMDIRRTILSPKFVLGSWSKYIRPITSKHIVAIGDSRDGIIKALHASFKDADVKISDILSFDHEELSGKHRKNFEKANSYFEEKIKGYSADWMVAITEVMHVLLAAIASLVMNNNDVEAVKLISALLAVHSTKDKKFIYRVKAAREQLEIDKRSVIRQMKLDQRAFMSTHNETQDIDKVRNVALEYKTILANANEKKPPQKVSGSFTYDKIRLTNIQYSKELQNEKSETPEQTISQLNYKLVLDQSDTRPSSYEINSAEESASRSFKAHSRILDYLANTKHLISKDIRLKYINAVSVHSPEVQRAIHRKLLGVEIPMYFKEKEESIELSKRAIQIARQSDHIIDNVKSVVFLSKGILDVVGDNVNDVDVVKHFWMQEYFQFVYGTIVEISDYFELSDPESLKSVVASDMGKQRAQQTQLLNELDEPSRVLLNQLTNLGGVSASKAIEEIRSKMSVHPISDGNMTVTYSSTSSESQSPLFLEADNSFFGI